MQRESGFLLVRSPETFYMRRILARYPQQKTSRRSTGRASSGASRNQDKGMPRTVEEQILH
ncbi:hypothetical protein KFK09_029144 [Dendrobium nobile]|uniref:Uncharacterized protein n=1 Tax=Dendrobium nobile TaxID=94219 RepID=A0A8T3A558_DENNO|nr:hypothetical protein KFK09_029144 [Dendrobium nobile]